MTPSCDREDEKITGSTRRLSYKEIRLLHRVGTRETPLDFSAGSLSTRSWFGLVGALPAAFDEGTTVLMDESDSSRLTAGKGETGIYIAARNANGPLENAES